MENRTGKEYWDWVTDYWTVRGNPLDFIDHKYLVQKYKDQSKIIITQKSGQAGETELNLSEACWLPDQFKENSLYLMPTSGNVNDIVQERVDEPINNSRYLSSVTGRAGKIMGKQADKTGLKRFNKGFIYFRGSNKPTQITSVPADAIYVDELDRMEPRYVPYFTKRLGHSKRKWERWFSTPTVPNFGINERFLKTDQLNWYVKCYHCGVHQIMDFWENIEFTMKGEDVDKSRIFCKKCKKDFLPYKCDGKWIPHNKDASIRGYFINQLYSPHFDLNAAIIESQTTAEYKVMQFYNQTLGLPYEPKGSKITEEILSACIRDYIIPLTAEDIAMGVDVGKNLHVITRDKNRILDIQELKYFTIAESNEKAGRQEDSIEYWIRAKNPKKVIVDALPETRAVQSLINMFPGRIYMCYYSGMNEVKEGEAWYKVDGYKVNTDRTMSLDESLGEIYKQRIQLPRNLSDYSVFKSHFKNLVRIIKENDKGDKKVEYQRLGDDHYAHANNYAKMAADMLTRIVESEIFTI